MHAALTEQLSELSSTVSNGVLETGYLSQRSQFPRAARPRRAGVRDTWMKVYEKMRGSEIGPELQGLVSIPDGHYGTAASDL